MRSMRYHGGLGVLWAFHGVSAEFEVRSRVFFSGFTKKSVVFQGCHERFMGFQGHSRSVQEYFRSIAAVAKGFHASFMGVPEGFHEVLGGFMGFLRIKGVFQGCFWVVPRWSRVSMSF